MNKNNRGFSLIEIMMVLGLAAGVGMVVMNLTQQMNSSQKRFQLDNDADFIMKEIAGILKDPMTCKQASTAATAGLGGLAPISATGKLYRSGSFVVLQSLLVG
jgi:prepilin-type N-terminal cleavage/methylation domain-containing protein